MHAAVPDLIARIAGRARASLAADAGGHDWWHTDRVRRTALAIAARDGGDPVVVELAALLHDVADHKLHGGDRSAGPRVAAAWLREEGAPEALVEAVVAVLASDRMNGHRGGGAGTPPEAHAVRDADYLDAIGAIGVARAFAYGGSRGRPMYTPAETAAARLDDDAYGRAGGASFTHFDEKLLHLRERLVTPTARRLGEERHRRMEAFIAGFRREADLADLEG